MKCSVIVTIIAIEILSSGCSTKEVELKNSFCKAYGAGSIIYWMIEGKPIKDGVADSLGGFQCKYFAAGVNEKVKAEDVCILNEEKKVVCTSKKYELKELCPTGEIGSFWDKEYEKSICK